MYKITSGIFETNTYFIFNKNECIVIDPGFDIQKKLDNLSTYTVVAVLLTHGHCDHIDSIGLFKCPIYIHEQDFEFLKNTDLSLYSMTNTTPSFKFNELNIKTFKDDEVLTIGNFTVNTLHTPGHTKGSSCFLIKNDLYSGDTLFKGTVGRVDFPTGDHKTILNSLKKIATLPRKTVIYPGHNEETTLKQELVENIFFRTINK